MAIAPEQVQRIGINRHFTTPDVHPYDTLAWESREARIPDLKTGGDAFYQPDVEFPVTWSQNATNIVAQKYFRGPLGAPEREYSVRQIVDRVADTITAWGIKDGYFADSEEAETFRGELKYILVHQRASFNSPVWFNIGVPGEPAQGSACFILDVDDTMDSILNWYREEGVIFKGGSGSGVNLSKIRSSYEELKGGGTASGPVSFMRGADASAGTIKSGGKTRRAAKMAILNVDHPDIEEFIWCKALEERKARALREAGFDMDLDGRDSHSIQYQNANNSVRVTDEFMRAVENDDDWDLKAVKDGSAVRTVKARDLMRQLAEAAWECADPGMQYDTTINHWHTAANTGRINASNPCFTGDTYVYTDKGLIQFAELVARAQKGETFGIYTHDATSETDPAERVVVSRPEAFMVTGWNEIVKLAFSNGAQIRCTPNHRFWTVNRGYVRADELTSYDEVKVLNVPAPASAADLAIPARATAMALSARGDKTSLGFRLPEKWTPELAHYLGWLVGDGCISGDVVSTVYGTDEEQTHILPGHRALAAWMNDGREPTPSVQNNGTVQLRQSRRPIRRFFEGLGISTKKAAGKVVPHSIEQAPTEIQAAFLRGLFDADGCVYDGAKSRYVGLGSASDELLRGVQRLLVSFGISSRIYKTRSAGDSTFEHTRKDGTQATYEGGAMYDLRIANRSIVRFAEEIGFEVPAKAERLDCLIAGHDFYATDETLRLRTRTDDGVDLTFNLSEPRNHSYIVNGQVVANCSEYMHLDNSACNLASINLLKYLGDDGSFDVDGYKHTAEVMFTAQEIIVGNADYPTEKIGDNARKFRQLGLGYANLGALLMARGAPYDSEEGRAWAAALTALMTGHAYATSARTASRMGPFAGYAENREPTLKVLSQHRAACADIDEELVPAELLDAARQSWDEACDLGERYGVRNAQATVLAPTGCLVGGTLVPTERGLVRLGTLGDVVGDQWQDLGISVMTDEGVRAATQFYVNGVEVVVDVQTARGYSLKGTPRHRVKVVNSETGEWVWKHFSDLREGDTVPLALNQLVGEPQAVRLPPFEEAYWAGEQHATAPREMAAELAELVGYFMGDGSLHAKGLRFCVSQDDFDVVEHLELLGKRLFGLEARIAQRTGYVEVAFNSVRLVEWWEACGLAKYAPSDGHSGKGWAPHIPNAVLYTNDREVYRAFLRGLFEADGSVTVGYPTWSTSSLEFCAEVQSLLLALGYPTTRKVDAPSAGRWGRGEQATLRLLNQSYNAQWLAEIGFLSGRKWARVDTVDGRQAARRDRIPVTRALIDRVMPANDRNRKAALMEYRRHGTISRRLATEIQSTIGDPELGHLLGFFYDTIASAELGEEELTFDLSVPDNVTYVANGFVSHNTIGLAMDCDTTGVEPDLALTKHKKLVGGGTMEIVNRAIPRALRNLGYDDGEVDEIIAYIDEHKTIVGAPALKAEHLPVFATAMGDNVIHYMGHVRMMAAVQPFISGAISKCVVGDTLIPTEEGLVRIGGLHESEAPDTFREHFMEVASLNGTHKTDAFYYGGVRPVREVVLRSGHRVVGTPNHRVLVAGEHGFDWRRLDEVDAGDYVATRYGTEMWAPIPARISGFTPSSPYGSQKSVMAPEWMTPGLAFLLGAYCAEGHTTRSNWTIAITNSDDGALERIASAWRSQFGVQPRIERRADRCPQVIVSSKTIVEFFEFLGCGGRASEKRIPDAVLRSNREAVIAFLEGLALDAYTAMLGTTPKWAICVDSPSLLDDLQAVLTNLGIVHSRITKHNAENGKDYDEVYACGTQAQALIRLVPFVEEHKRQRANALLSLTPAQSSADVVPGVSPRALYEMIPRGKSGRNGVRIRTEFAFLCDPRTKHVSRRTLERVAAVPGVVLPDWLVTILRDNLHFSPVSRVEDSGDREVFDVSVPMTHAFVGNGIVNHNTINMPEEATVEEVADLYVESWKLGLKAVAIYRDNCKVAQPLSTQKRAGAAIDAGAEQGERQVERVVETVIIQQPVRQKLQKTRNSKTFSFRVADCKGYCTVGEFEDGRPGELFLKVAKQGSTLAGIMDSFAIGVSLGLQYGVPLRAFVEKYTSTRFEPAGMTDDKEIRFASSLVDYIFRRLAVQYMDPEERAGLGIHTVSERTQPTLPGVEEAVTPSQAGDLRHPELDFEPARDEDDEYADGTRATGSRAPTGPEPPAPARMVIDAPLCTGCGAQMRPSGSCYVCTGCGSTSGCS